MEKVYTRTKGIQPDMVDGFCPGCMHSTLFKLIGEVLEEMNMLDKCTCAIGVGCCGLGMGYFTYDYLLAAHGRACAVATGAKRSNPDTLVFTYQGFKYVGVAGKQISQGMEIPMMYMYGIMPVCGIICAICVVIKIITLYKADISYFAPKNQALSRDDA